MNGTNDVLDTNLGLDQVAIGAERFTAGTLIVAAQGGHHDDLDVLGLGRATKNIEHVETADLRHHHVANNQVGTLFDGCCERFFAIAS